MKAYAAVAYLLVYSFHSKRCVLIGSKTKVAPKKIISVPRLELLAAVLGARFSSFIEREHTLNISRRYFWSDSKNVLSWIRSEARNYRQFVAFRISEIMELTNVKEWKWVPTSQNVADEATKRASTPEIYNSSRWFQGPQYLLQDEVDWPAEETRLAETDCERVHVIQKHRNTIVPTPDPDRISKWSWLVHSQAYIHRFCKNISSKIRGKSKNSGPFTFDEIDSLSSLPK